MLHIWHLVLELCAGQVVVSPYSNPRTDQRSSLPDSSCARSNIHSIEPINRMFRKHLTVWVSISGIRAVESMKGDGALFIDPLARTLAGTKALAAKMQVRLIPTTNNACPACSNSDVV